METKPSSSMRLSYNEMLRIAELLSNSLEILWAVIEVAFTFPKLSFVKEVLSARLSQMHAQPSSFKGLRVKDM